MDSGSGKNQDDTGTKEPVDSLRQSEESAAAAAAAAESPPLAPESEITEVEGHGPPKAGGQNRSSDTATAAAAEQKGSASAWPPLPSRPPSVPAGGIGKPPLPPRPPFVSSAGGPSSSGIDSKGKAQGMPRQQDEQAKSLALLPKKGKKSLWRKVLDRIGISNRKYTSHHVNDQKLHITELMRHYNPLALVSGRAMEFHLHAPKLRNSYAAFRPVLGDGECFYRSFIFAYLEQVLDRQDTHEEHRVLAAVKGVARQHARLGWASEFSRSRKAFKKLIKKVMRWKTQRGWRHIPTVNSYRMEKLLEFFNDYKRTGDIFTFLRFVAAIWICSHSEDFVLLIPELNEDHTLTEWCFQEVIRRKVYTDHIQIIALVRALRVPLRVEYLFQAVGQDLYIGQGPQDDMPRGTRWPRRHHQVPPDHEVPRVTVLHTQEHYDIIYPCHPDGPVTSGGSSGQRSDKTESQAAKSQISGGSSGQRSDKTESQAAKSQIGSSSGKTSNQQIGRVEGSTSTGEKSDEHTAEEES